MSLGQPRSSRPDPISPSSSAPAEASAAALDGLRLAPFRALRFALTSGEELGAVTSPPYDVIDDEHLRSLEQRHPHNVVRLILPREEPGPAQLGSRYRRAATLLADWRAQGVLRAESEPALYVYEMRVGSHATRGLLGAVGLVDPDARAAAGLPPVIVPHENTMAAPVADRLALTQATEANLEPIYLVYAGGGAASRLVAEPGGGPLAEATVDGEHHVVWSVTDAATLREVAADLLPRRAVIADGHHRYATYLAHQRQRRATGAGAGPWDFGLALLVDATTFGPQVAAIHRVLPTLPLGRAAAAAAAGFRVRELATPLTPDQALATLADAGRAGPAFVLTDGAGWVLLDDPAPAGVAAAVPPAASPALRELDVTIAHRYLVRLWGLEDREDLVDYRHDVPAALAAARATGGSALLLNPTPVAAVLAVAEAGERMPRKSTLFTPKPRTGLVLRAYADEPAGTA